MKEEVSSARHSRPLLSLALSWVGDRCISIRLQSQLVSCDCFALDSKVLEATVQAGTVAEIVPHGVEQASREHTGLLQMVHGMVES
jgi:hypothetical protein